VVGFGFGSTLYTATRYDIDRNRREVEAIKKRLAEIKKELADLVGYAIRFLDSVLEKHGSRHVRMTEITDFQRIDVREAASRELTLRYDPEKGYLGYSVPEGDELERVSSYDRILVIDGRAVYRVIDAPDKAFVGKGMLYAGLADRDALAERVFTLVYRNPDGETYIKRFRIEGYILEKAYPLVAEGSRPLLLTTRESGTVRLKYRKKPRMQKLEEEFQIDEYLIKSAKAVGVRLSAKDVSSIRLLTRTR
jgi:topoisomerase-4 subunit A